VTTTDTVSGITGLAMVTLGSVAGVPATKWTYLSTSLLQQPRKERFMLNTSTCVKRLNQAPSSLTAGNEESERAVRVGKGQATANRFRRRRFDRVFIGFWFGGLVLGAVGCLLGAVMPYHHPIAVTISVLWCGIYCGCLGASIGALVGLFSEHSPALASAGPKGAEKPRPAGF
jgi:hypothetical protein